MQEVNVKLGSLEAAASFVKLMEQNNVKADISVGRYSLDAKSLMGILSMDLNKSLCLTLYEDEHKNKEIIESISMFIEN